MIMQFIWMLNNILLTRDKELTKTKERGEIIGSTRKIKKQKGTGTAQSWFY